MLNSVINTLTFYKYLLVRYMTANLFIQVNFSLSKINCLNKSVNCFISKLAFIICVVIFNKKQKYILLWKYFDVWYLFCWSDDFIQKLEHCVDILFFVQLLNDSYLYYVIISFDNKIKAFRSERTMLQAGLCSAKKINTWVLESPYAD